MFSKIIKSIKKIINKIRIFKKLRDLKDLADRLRGQMIEKRKLIDELKKRIIETDKDLSDAIEENHKFKEGYDKLEEKKEKATQHIAIMAKKRDEFLKRILSKTPDDIITADFNTYKTWLMEPFMEKAFMPYEPVDERSVFIDGYSMQNFFRSEADENSITKSSDKPPPEIYTHIIEKWNILVKQAEYSS